MDNEKATVIAKIVGKLETLKEQLDELKEKEQKVFDEMSERQQESKKGEALQEMIDNLDTAYSDLDDAINILEDYTEGISYEEENKEDEQVEDVMAALELKPQKLKVSANTDFPKNLRKNIEVITNTFEVNNLQCVNVGCKYSIDKKDHCLHFFVEISGKLKNQKKIMVNLYDEDDDLINSNYTYLNPFSGLYTESLRFYSKTADLENAVRARVYITG